MKKTRPRRHIPKIRRATAPGAAPGALVADPKAPKPTIEVFAYGPDAYIEHQNTTPATVRGLLGHWPVVWVNVSGLGDVAQLTELGGLVNMHSLALEDVLHVHQRPKIEPYEDHVFIVMRMVEVTDQLQTEQVSMVLGSTYLFTFQERPGDCFDAIRHRIRSAQSKVRRSPPCFLMYMVMDAGVDAHFPVLEGCGQRLEQLDDAIEAANDRSFLPSVHALKQDLLVLRRSVWPLRDALGTLIHDDSRHISAETRVYLRDVYDHTVQLLDLLETYRELVGGMLEVYLSSVNNRLNEVIKVLTVVATIFIPLTFITGFYGMNIDIPGRDWRWMFFLLVGVMVIAASGMLIAFRHRGWLTHNGAHKSNSTLHMTQLMSQETEQRR